MMKILHVFTEEPSAKILFDTILPKILPPDIYFRVYQHQGKQDLEKALRTTVPSISRIPGARILVTRDQDSADCKLVKRGFDDIMSPTCRAPYKIRIACKELEAWYLGDLNAVALAYPRFNPQHYLNKAEYRVVDQITNPNRTLLDIIPEYSGRNKLPKLEASEKISEFLDLDSNRSESFNQTIRSIRDLVAQ